MIMPENFIKNLEQNRGPLPPPPHHPTPKKNLENVFVKHYAPNHIPDPKGEWSLKENNSELHYGNIQKLISSSTPWSVTICQISGSYPKQVFRYFVHKVLPIQNACV